MSLKSFSLYSAIILSALLTACHQRETASDYRLPIGTWRITGFVLPHDRSRSAEVAQPLLQGSLSIKPDSIQLNAGTIHSVCYPMSFKLSERYVKQEPLSDIGTAGAFELREAELRDTLIFKSKAQCEFEIYVRQDIRKLFVPWQGVLLVLESDYALKAKQYDLGEPSPNTSPTPRPNYIESGEKSSMSKN